MLALKLGREPDDKEAHRIVREWLQDRLDRSADPRRIHVSQWLQAQIVDTIISPKLRDAWWNWFDQAEKTGKFRGRRIRAKLPAKPRRTPKRR